jgi:hypothetical protein
MAQTGFTPIQIYRSSTASAAPTSGNLVAGELAINTADGKLFYLDSLNAVQVIGWKLVPATAGGTGLSTYTTGDIIYSSATNTLSKLGIGSAGQVLTVVAGSPAWAAAGGGMVYPSAGIPNSTGSAWGTSYTTSGTGTIVSLADSPSLTGAVTIGSTTGTSTLILGQSTGAQTVNIATGVTAAATTKAINIGTAGNASSSTNIAIGSATGATFTTIEGGITIGSTSGTTSITLGRSTAAQTVNIATGVNTSTTKTINIGTGSGSGANNITIGTGFGTNTINIGTSSTSPTALTTVKLGTTGQTQRCRVKISEILYQEPIDVASLNSSGADAGSRAIVFDADLPIFGQVVIGDGGTMVPVYYDGSDWRVG